MSKKNQQPDVKVGQVWKENAPRIERYVRVTCVRADGITLIRVEADGSPYRGAVHTCAMPKRFNGNRGGYAIHFNPHQ